MFDSIDDILAHFVYKQDTASAPEEKAQISVRIDAARADCLGDMAKMFGVSKTALATFVLEAAISELFRGLPEEMQDQHFGTREEEE